MKNRRVWVLLIVLSLCGAAFAVPVENRGIYALWYGDDLSILEAPYVTGGQIVCQWRDVEPEKGQYDFSIIARQLQRLGAMGCKTTIQSNGIRKPEWLFEEVPYTPERLSIQVRDEKGTLMYWHPTHRSAYIRMLKQFAHFMRSARDRDALIGMRLNFNAIGTEHLHVPHEYRRPEAWMVPGGVDPGQSFGENVNLEYQDAIVAAFVEHIAPLVKLFVRNGIRPEIEERYREHFDSGKLGWFHTSSEAEPRSTGTEFRYMRFYRWLCPRKLAHVMC
jgi:hypothetical protein